MRGREPRKGASILTGARAKYFGWRTHELWCAEWKKDGSLTKEKRVFVPTGDEWLEPFALMRGSLQYRVTGDLCFWSTVSPGGAELERNRNTWYVSTAKETAAVSREALPAREN